MDESGSVETVAAVASAPIEAVAAPPPAPASTPAASTDSEPHWLAPRLERERQKILKDLGVDGIDDAKKAIAELRAKQDSEKSADQRAAELKIKLDASEAERNALQGVVAIEAGQRMAALTGPQRAAVIAIAGEDAAVQLKTIVALSSTWTVAASAATGQVQPQAINTAPARTAPNGENVSPPSHLAAYEDLKAKNPLLASEYLLQHRTSILDERKARG